MDLAASRVAAIDLDAELARFYPALVRRLTLVLANHSDAEDIAQSAIERALRSRARFHGGNVHAWLMTIALRLSFNELRRRRREALARSSISPHWVIPADADLWQALTEIEPPARAALLLNVLDGYTYDEISRMLDVPVGTVASWISRTKGRLRTILTEDYDGPH